MRKTALVAIVSIVVGFLVGAGFMYLVDTAWITETKRLNRSKLNSMKIHYSNALDVSGALVNNCYDAFYVVSKCNTKEGCNFESTIGKLTKLNVERKNLEFKLDQLLTPSTPNFSPSETL